MSNDLSQSRNVSGQNGSSKMTSENSARADGWSFTETAGVKMLSKIFNFNCFADALAFSSRVETLVQNQDFYPMMITEMNKVTVTWWTHIIDVRDENDFFMAGQTDALYQETA